MRLVAAVPFFLVLSATLGEHAAASIAPGIIDLLRDLGADWKI